jgi:hypothetical protein
LARGMGILWGREMWLLRKHCGRGAGACAAGWGWETVGQGLECLVAGSHKVSRKDAVLGAFTVCCSAVVSAFTVCCSAVVSAFTGCCRTQYLAPSLCAAARRGSGRRLLRVGQQCQQGHHPGCPDSSSCRSRGTVKTLILRRICQPHCSGIKYYISSYAPRYATE